MREAVLILLVIAVLLALTAYRYRRQIMAGVQVWRMLKAMKQGMTVPPGEKETSARSKMKNARLVKCAKCSTWVEEDRGIRLGNSSVFCSTACLERAATANTSNTA